RLYQIASLRRHRVRILAIPLDAAAQGIGKRRRNRLPGSEFAQRIVKVVDRHLLRFLRLINAAPGVYELAILVEYKEMRCPQRSIAFGDLLSYVMEIRQGETLLLHHGNHMLE